MIRLAGKCVDETWRITGVWMGLAELDGFVSSCISNAKPAASCMMPWMLSTCSCHGEFHSKHLCMTRYHLRCGR